MSDNFAYDLDLDRGPDWVDRILAGMAEQTWIQEGRPGTCCCQCGSTDDLSLVIPYCLDDEACRKRRAARERSSEGENDD